MDPFLSGLCQRYIDSQLEESEIQNIRAIIDLYGMAIKNKLDATLGFFMGYSYAQLLMQFFILNNRLPSKDETLQYYKLMKRRFPEIISEMKKIKISQLKEHEEQVILPIETQNELAQQSPS